MLARLQGQARHTLDIDLYSRDGDLTDAERALHDAAGVDLGDYFGFTLGPPKRIAQGAGALRIPVVARLGATDFARFHVDLVARIRRRTGLARCARLRGETPPSCASRPPGGS